jgi:HAD superfamily hydrolase (TIGR01509 family)
MTMDNAVPIPAYPSVPKTTNMAASLMAQRRFEVVLWDWDGVLVDSRQNFYQAYEAVLREEGIATSTREIFLREGEPTPVLLRALLEKHRVPVDENKIQQLVARRREHDIRIGGRKLFPTVARLLHRVRQAGCRNGLVTGSSRNSLERVLQREQAQWFDVIVTADDVVHGKPNPEPFLHAMQTLEVRSDACIVMENAPFGIQSARAAGCAVLAIGTTLPREDLREANWVVNDHEELELLLFGDLPQDGHPNMNSVTGDSR